MAAETLISARWVIPVSSSAILEHHSVAIENGLIKAVLPTNEAKTLFPEAQQIDCRDHALLPGLINSHTHAAMNLLRGIADDRPLKPWLEEHIWPAEQRWLSERFVHDGTMHAIAEMLRAGTTTFNDMYLFPDVAAHCALQTGIRAGIGLIVMDFPTPWAKDANEYLTKGLALRDEIKGNALIHLTLAPHAPYTVSDEPLSRLAALANELELPVHMHVHETLHEVEESLKLHGVRPLERLDRLGLVTPTLQAVHMTSLNSSDLALMASAGASVVHCPESNAKLASGHCPVAKLQQMKIPTALGTDGAASNNDLDMFGEMRSAALLAKSHAQDAATLDAFSVLEMATLNGAKSLGISDITGSIEPGKSADLIAVNLNTVESQPVYDPVSTLVYATSSHQVEHVWVAGRLLLHNRKLTTINEANIRQKAVEWREKIQNHNEVPS